MRRSASELSIEWPPSMPINEAILPLVWIRSMSAAVSASSNVWGYRRSIRWTMSIWPSVAETAACPWSSTGT